MRLILFLLLSVYSINIIASAEQNATRRASAFYLSYLQHFSSGSAVNYPNALLEQYVAAQTINLLEKIERMPEQDIVQSDYFTYSQDYDPAWIASLKIGEARPLLGGEVVQVWLGVEEGKMLHLEVFMRCEEGLWKIYRVRDVTHNYEHPIFLLPTTGFTGGLCQ